MINLAQIGFLIGAAILVCKAAWEYPLISLAVVVVAVLFIASKIKNGIWLWK